MMGQILESHREGGNFSGEMHLVAAAEIFYLRLRRMLPGEDIKQLRIGYDRKAGTPTILAIIDKKHDDYHVEIMEMGTSLDLEMFQKYNFHVSFWVMTDRTLDMPLIENDFPYMRSVVSRYEEDTETETHQFPPYGMSGYADRPYSPIEFADRTPQKTS